MTTHQQDLKPEDMVKLVTEGVKLAREWGRPLVGALRGKFKSHRDPAVQTLAASLDEVLREGHRCFAPSGNGSFIHVTSNSGLQTEPWRDVNDKLAQSSDWYDSIMTVPSAGPATIEGLAHRFIEVTRLLFWTGRAGQQLGALVRTLPPHDVSHAVYARLADHYNLFVTKYETLLAKVPGAQPLHFDRLPR